MRTKNNDSLNFSILSHLKKTGHANLSLCTKFKAAAHQGALPLGSPTHLREALHALLKSLNEETG
jgi:hypothetical protein